MGERQKVGPQSWISGEQISTSSGICLEDSHGLWPWIEEGSRRAGSSSPSQKAENQVWVAGGLYGCANSAEVHSDGSK